MCMKAAISLWLPFTKEGKYDPSSIDAAGVIVKYLAHQLRHDLRIDMHNGTQWHWAWVG